MAEIAGWDFEKRSDRLFLHFDVQDNFLNLDTFIATADSARRVIISLNETFFDGALEYEIIVLPPEAASFLSRLALWVGGGATAVVGFLNTEIGGAFVEGLTDRPPSDWATELGQEARELIENALEHIEDENAGTDLSAPAEADEPDTSADRAACNASARIVVAMTRGVLEKPSHELNRIDLTVGKLANALEARADFYSACLEDRNVKGIGFSLKDDFPIPRNSFPERAQKPARKDEEETPPPWVVSVENINVTSPNWDQEDQSSRQWKGKDQNRRDCYFVIEDAEFWRRVSRKELRVEVLNNLKVQWACQIVDGRPKSRRVLRVIEFNGEALADPLTPDAISAILGDYSTQYTTSGQPSLFDD